MSTSKGHTLTIVLSGRPWPELGGDPGPARDNMSIAGYKKAVVVQLTVVFGTTESHELTRRISAS